MITMTEREFKMMDLEFRTRASRLCRAKYQEVKTLLSKFIYHIEHTAILNEYVQGCDPNMADADIRAMTDRVISGWGEVSFDFGNNTSEEVARQYRVLKYADECEDVGRIFGIGRAFDHDSHYQSSVEGFVHGVVSPFVDNINLYLHSIAMNVCASPEKNITINVPGDNAQINIAQDGSTVNAVQSNKIGSWSSIEAELVKLRVAADDIAELKDILAHESPSAKDDFGPKINQWMAKIVVKASQGLVDLSMATASSVLATLICKYYGWS
jgi:hypothetical protein